MAHYYPAPDAVATSAPPTSGPDFDTRADLISGWYRLNRMSYTNAGKVMALFSSFKVNVMEDGTLFVAGERFVETEPFVFREVNGDNMLIFQQDAQGAMAHAFLDDLPVIALERVPGVDMPLLHYALLGVSMLAFLSVLVGGPVISLARRGCAKTSHPAMAKAARWVLGGVSLMCVLFMLLVGPLVVEVISGDTQSWVTGHVPFGYAWPIAFGLIVALALAALFFVVMAWKNRYWGVLGRVHYTIATLSAWALIWFIQYWHLLCW